jgi:hypothetical protein
MAFFALNIALKVTSYELEGNDENKVDMMAISTLFFVYSLCKADLLAYICK